MRVGSLVYATDSGLGILAKSFYDHGVLTDALVVEHSHHQTHKEWYPNSSSTPIRQFDNRQVAEFCASMDVMLFFETPFDWNLIEYCKSVNTKTVLMPMYECMPKVHPQPDLYLNPSALDKQYYPQGIHIPVPVEVPWRLREKAEVFIHNAGHGGLRGRNGTAEVLQAFRHTQSPAKLVIRSQKEQDWPPYPELMYRAFLDQRTLPYEELYATGDVFLFPEKFNGLSLPLQEARAAGMLVMGTDRFPMNEWLPREPLIPIAGYQTASISPRCLEFQEALISPRDITAKVDEWFGRDISEYSKSGREWASTMSWEVLKPRYMEALNSL